MKLSTASYILNALLIAAVILLAFKACEKPPKSEIVAGIDSVTYWKTKAGQEVASRKYAEEALGIITRDNDSLARELGTKTKFLRDYTILYQQAKAKLAGAGNTKIVYDTVYAGGDTTCPPQIKSLSEIFANPYYTVHATIERSGIGSVAEVQSYDTVTVVTREVSEGGLFNRKRFLQIDIMNRNPYNVITGLKAYRRPIPNSGWALSVEGEALYLDRSFHALTGLNLNVERPRGSFGASGGVSDFSKTGYGKVYGRFRLLPIKPK